MATMIDDDVIYNKKGLDKNEGKKMSKKRLMSLK